jgi:hypothetical protein
MHDGNTYSAVLTLHSSAASDAASQHSLRLMLLLRPSDTANIGYPDHLATKVGPMPTLKEAKHGSWTHGEPNKADSNFNMNKAQSPAKPCKSWTIVGQLPNYMLTACLLAGCYCTSRRQRCYCTPRQHCSTLLENFSATPKLK